MATKESGLRPQRLHFIREDEQGITPSDPEMLLYSNNVASAEFTPDAGVTAQRGIGSAAPKEHRATVEASEGSIEYHQVRPLVTDNFTDPSGSSTLGVKSTDSGDTDIDVTVYNSDQTTSETITTDGTDATTFVTGSTSFSAIGRIEVGSSHAGTIEVYTDNSGSPGDLLADLESGVTDQEDEEPLDAAFDAILRDDNNDLANSHTIVHREVHNGEGVNGTGRHIYTVGLGAFADAEMSGDATDDTGANYITIRLDYQFEKLRSYQIDQPEGGGENLEVESTDSADTSQSVIIENEDASTTETVSLNGTTTETTTASFEEIDAVYITDGSGNPSETEGDVIVTGASSSNELTRLRGAGSYDEAEGDEGIPALGSGNKEESISGDYSLFLGSEFEWPASNPVGERVSNFTLSIDNSIEATPDSSSRRQSIDAGNQTPQMTAGIFGESETHKKFVDHFTTKTDDLIWTTSKEELTLSSATINDPGSRTLNAGEAIMQNDVQFEGTGLGSSQV